MELAWDLDLEPNELRAWLPQQLAEASARPQDDVLSYEPELRDDSLEAQT